EKTVVQQRAGLLPIADNHVEQCAIFCHRRSNLRGFLEVGGKIILEEPITRLSQLGFASQIIDLPLKLGLLMGRFYIRIWHCRSLLMSFRLSFRPEALASIEPWAGLRWLIARVVTDWTTLWVVHNFFRSLTRTPVPALVW